jgi:hypothetical protein
VVLMVNSGALIDSYTSGNGSYGGSNIGSNGNVIKVRHAVVRHQRRLATSQRVLAPVKWP